MSVYVIYEYFEGQYHDGTIIHHVCKSKEDAWIKTVKLADDYKISTVSNKTVETTVDIYSGVSVLIKHDSLREFCMKKVPFN